MFSFFSLFQFFGLTSLLVTLTAAHATAIDHHEPFSFVTPSQPASFSTSIESFHHLNSHFDRTLNVLSTFAFASSKSNNDTFTFREMLRQDDIPNFTQAMRKEVNDRNEREHWDLITRSEMPSGMKTILAVWPFKRKCLPDGKITKWKARLYCHGGMQQWGVN